MRPLFEITDDLRRILDLADDAGGELDQAAADYLAGVEREDGVKLDGYVNLIRTLETEAAVAVAEAEQFRAKAAAREAKAAALKERLMTHLLATGRTRASTATGRAISVQANGGKVPLRWAFAVDVADVPIELTVVRREIDKDAVRVALERGELLPFASLGERGTHLRIK